MTRWLEVLASFNYELEYRQGRRHQNADGLSRIPCRQCVKIGAVDNSEEDGREDANRHLRNVERQTGDLGTAESQETERVVCVMGAAAASVEVDDPEQVMTVCMEYEEEGEAELLASDPTLENGEKECVGWDTESLGFEPILGDNAESVDETACQGDGRVSRAQTSPAEVVQSPQDLLSKGSEQEKPSDCPPNSRVNQIGAEPKITLDKRSSAG